jgi:hypothetical protein
MCDCQQKSEEAQEVGQTLQEFVSPLLEELDRHIDRRLVRTFLQTLQAIATFRHSRYGLLLSELGGYVLSPDKAPAGTKRISNLLRSTKWTYHLIEQFLWQRANEKVEELEAEDSLALAVWDESVVEKPESIELEGLCPVRSSKSARLKRIKPGYFNPPGGRPVFVPGMQWLSVMVLGMSGPPVLAAMHWWTTRGKFASSRREELRDFIRRTGRAWGQQVVHVWDRGFAASPWIGHALAHDLRFIVRWKKAQHLVDGKGKRNAWKITRGKRSMGYRYIWDARRHCQRKTGIFFTPVHHPDYDVPLTLVVSRPGTGRSPWYLLTNEPIHTVEDAWTIVFAYARRWQVEMAYRFSKTELAMESPRLWFWDNRLKLMLMVSLVYAFLLSLLTSGLDALLASLLRHWCHRTGKRHRDVSLPLYRLRSALSRLWLHHPPTFSFQTPG